MRWSAQLRSLLEGPSAPLAAIATELLAVVVADLPVPTVRVVDHLGDAWLGLCEYRPGADNTTLYVQKRILGDVATVQRVVAHEICHHVEFLTAWRAAQARGETKQTYALVQRMQNRVHGGHGAGFRALAAVFNAKYGAGYVSQHSDEAFKEQAATRDLLVLIWHRNDKFLCAMAQRPGPKQRAYLARRATAYDAAQYKLVRTRDVQFVQVDKIGEGYSMATDATMVAALRTLWASAPAVAMDGDA
jgi:hypothetical protein